MSYDIYSYQPTSKTPSAREAESIITSVEGQARRDDDEAREIKRKVADALMEHNPRLEPFKIDHSKVAEAMKITEQEAKAQWNHIELDPPEGDLAIQLTIHCDQVSIAIPYWYTGAKADEVFTQVTSGKNSGHTGSTTESQRTCLRSSPRERRRNKSLGGNSGSETDRYNG